MAKSSRENVIAKVRLELAQIDELCEAYADLLQSSRQGVPGLGELTIMASVLHSFYNGVENVFTLIAKGIDREFSNSPQSHNDLLNQMGRPHDRRSQVISKNLAETLSGYLSFRHFYRHAYAFRLKWERMDELVIGLTQARDELKGEVNQFLEDLQVDQQ